MAMSAGVVLASKAEGGIMKSLKRAALGGESFFVSTYTAPCRRAASSTSPPGCRVTSQLTRLHLERRSSSRRGSWLANEVNVKIDAPVGRLQEPVRRRRRVHHPCRRAGHDRVCLLRRVGDVDPGSRSVDHDRHRPHGAYEDTVQMPMRKASGGGLVQSFKSGEGYVFDFSGPGRVWTQTRNPTELMGWIQSFVGTGNSSGTSFGWSVWRSTRS